MFIDNSSRAKFVSFAFPTRLRCDHHATTEINVKFTFYLLLFIRKQYKPFRLCRRNIRDGVVAILLHVYGEGEKCKMIFS